ncbi:hypothetical protein [Viridibacillus sp. FSL H8-0123]|uniref:hypothetical protein n=1 Tax=Viridibacillus sp. FSL H8-0123 TaxID=1928922 RepID=UPI00096CC4A1|nr:hypothetical protein [Viridibacillus sp. FSL H8-0123]OMC83357.1 hypothetical protein BK130_07365 [Viridibacillus sp. FSL H8-0123]
MTEKVEVTNVPEVVDLAGEGKSSTSKKTKVTILKNVKLHNRVLQIGDTAMVNKEDKVLLEEVDAI